MRAQIHIIHAKRYNFRDKESGRTISGCKVTYLGDKQDEVDSRGLPPCTVNAPLEMFEKFGQVPGNYEVDFAQRPSGTKTELVIKEANFVQKA